MPSWRLALVLAAVACAAPVSAAPLEDPTRPALAPRSPAAPAPAVGGPRLSSVLIAAHTRSALIDGRRVQVGDEIAGARVVAIGLGEVRLAREAQEIVLTLSDAGLKRPSSSKRDAR